MEKHLNMVENSQQKVEIDGDKLNFFISKVSIWEHFGITKNSYLCSTVDEKETMLKRYYSALCQKYYVTGKNLSFFSFCSGKKRFFSGSHYFEYVSLGGSLSNNATIDQ